MDDVMVDPGVAEVTSDVSEPDVATEDTSSAETESTTVEGAEPIAAPAAAPTPLIENGRLSEAAKATIDRLTQEDPQLGKQLKEALFQTARYRQEFPGGLKEMRALRDQVQEWGGPEAVQKTREELAFFHDIDQQFTSGDPRFLQALTDTPEGQSAFLKLAPEMLGKFASLNPEGHSSYIAQTIVADLQAHRFPLMMERLADFIQDNPKAVEVWQKMAGYLNRLDEFARKPIVSDKAPPPAAAPSNDLDTREANLTRSEWRSASDRDRVQVFEGELARQLQGRKPSDVQLAAIKELYASKLSKSIAGLPRFEETLQRYFDARDQKGYLRYLSTVHREQIPRALRAAVDAILPSKPGPKPAVAAKPAAPAAPTNGTAGYSRVAQRPGPHEIDFSRTTQEMYIAKRATLKSGKKVQW